MEYLYPYTFPLLRIGEPFPQNPVSILVAQFLWLSDQLGYVSGFIWISWFSLFIIILAFLIFFIIFHGLGTVIPMLEAVMDVVPIDKLAVHFHDTYGQSLPNILISLQVSNLPFKLLSLLSSQMTWNLALSVHAITKIHHFNRWGSARWTRLFLASVGVHMPRVPLAMLQQRMLYTCLMGSAWRLMWISLSSCQLESSSASIWVASLVQRQPLL